MSLLAGIILAVVSFLAGMVIGALRILWILVDEED